MDAPRFNGEPGREHDPNHRQGPPIRYQCVDCAWRGREAYRHHKLAHHRIALPNGLLVAFSCCTGQRKRDVA